MVLKHEHENIHFNSNGIIDRCRLRLGRGLVHLVGLLNLWTALALGWLGVKLLVRFFPALPATPPTWAVVTALVVSVGVGIIFGFLPARRATRLDPVAALGPH